MSNQILIDDPTEFGFYENRMWRSLCSINGKYAGRIIQREHNRQLCWIFDPASWVDISITPQSIHPSDKEGKESASFKAMAQRVRNALLNSLED